MAEFRVQDADKYAGNAGAPYFALKDDRDSKKVRFLFDSIDDVRGYCVHQVQVGDKKRYVNCLHEYGKPKDDCPFCRAGKFTVAKYFIPLLNLEEDKVQMWERGRTFGDRLTSICARNPHLMTHGFEIERVGKKGDTKTTYEIYSDPSNDDPDFDLNSYEIPNPLGTIILDKSPEDMEFFLETGEFPQEDESENERPVRRNTNNDDYSRPVRRTPAAGRDRF